MPLVEDCAVLLHMDEDQWTGAPDEVTNSCTGHHGTVAPGSATTVAGGVRGRAGGFSGAGCVQIADAPELRPTTGVTFSAWFEPQLTDGTPQGLVSKRADVNVDQSFSLILFTGAFVWVDIDGNDNRFSAGSAVMAGFGAMSPSSTMVGYRSIAARLCTSTAC